MKQIISTLVLGLVSWGAMAQNKNCDDPHSHQKIVNVNSALETQGFSLVFTGNVALNNKAGFAYKLNVKKGTTYQINMVLPTIAKKMTITVLDHKRNVLLEEQMLSKQSETVWTKLITADKDDNYIIIINSKGEYCYPLSILKKNI